MKHLRKRSLHGKTGTRIYKAYCHMVERCANPKDARYKDYGGRGITICERWLIASNFFEDMGEMPIGFSLERIDNNQGYSKENCKWASRLEQQNNTRANRIVEFRGKSQTVSQWCRELGLKRKAIGTRLERGWSIERAFTLPPCKK